MSVVGALLCFAFGMLLGFCDIHWYEPRYWAINALATVGVLYGYHLGKRCHHEWKPTYHADQCQKCGVIRYD